MSFSTIDVRKTNAGIPVIIEAIPSARSSGYLVAVRTGSRDESSNIGGLSHLLEHVVFRATKTRTSFQMSKEIEGAGGEFNAFTSKEMTAFYAVTIKETEPVAKDIVGDIVANPVISKEATELEKSIVMQEISMVENDPEKYIHDLFDMAIWKGHELAQTEAGTTDTVRNLTNVDLRNYYENKYKAPNFTVFGVGAVNGDDVVEWSESIFDPLVGGNYNQRKKPDVCNSGYTLHRRNEDHCYMAMGFKSYESDNPKINALKILSIILGHGISSRLFQSVREEKALVYSIYSMVNQYTDAGHIASFMSSTSENVLEAITTTAKVYKQLKDEGLTKGELARSKNIFKGSLIRSMESTEHRMFRLAIDTMTSGKSTTLEERTATLDAVTEEDVMKVANEILDPKRLNVVMLGSDVQNMKDFSVDQLDF
ncbi:MAG: insulinase family protein [archaeon]|nr:insulinase family protein [archaeon]